MRPFPWKVGDMARHTGLTVRTLHHYDHIGLLQPGAKTESGHRLYGKADLTRLICIKSLRSQGFSLEEIRELLLRPEFSAAKAIERHLDRLSQEIELKTRLKHRLERVANALRRQEEVPVDQLVNTIEVMTMFEKYYTKEQLAELDRRAKKLGPEALEQAQRDWQDLFASFRDEMAKGTPAQSDRVQNLTRRYRELIEAFTGGNKGIEASLGHMYRENPNVAAQYGFNMDSELMTYISKAMTDEVNS
ncbi:TipAS antibiotic-recognition domain-containing protein [Sulfidibacter corallicola]|uniref:TipAS antibiotic-recognition domain-containing protein n=1 Tax=Sulfidibacter corallicola TaxID=2818388 RepID=A0A8A4THL6_SULCO|nr:TipAS antibiotic-recognition domain-containing protein [Sulfidibacter corallicola]QTD49040.1 TipAS antibiotic-recognition domain-containing protein [Sulfidibacter corallicola]